MKLALINPRYDPEHAQPPLGLLRIAASAEQEGWNVKLIDGNVLDLSPFEVANHIPADVDLVGLTGMTPIVNYAFEVANFVKASLDVPILLGGSHITILPVETMKSIKEIDIGVISEGEETLRELLKYYDEPEKLKTVKGIIYREGGKIITTKHRPFLKNLDVLPYPAYHLLEKPLTKYRPFPPHGRKLPFMSIVSSRGCPFNCTFCSHNVWGRVFNTFSANYVYEQIRFLMEQYNVKYIQFYDDSFTLKRKRIMELCGLLKNLDIDWSCETRVNCVDRELLTVMKQAGCNLIGFGLESGVQRVLDVLNKQITLNQSRKAIELCDDLGITSIAYMMLGCPSETEKEILESMNFVNSLPLDYVQWSICTPYLGTPLYQQARQRGVQLPESWADWVYANLGSVRKSSSFVANENLTVEELKEHHIKAYRSFYSRTGYVTRRLRKMLTSWTEIKTTWNGLKMFMNMLENDDGSTLKTLLGKFWGWL